MVHDYMNAINILVCYGKPMLHYLHSYMSSFLLNHHYQMVIHQI